MLLRHALEVGVHGEVPDWSHDCRKQEAHPKEPAPCSIANDKALLRLQLLKKIRYKQGHVPHVQKADNTV